MADLQSRSARAHGVRHLTEMSPEKRAQIEREWADNSFNAGYDFTRRWAEGEV
ncbi:MAG: hypothetical protein ACRCVX_12310 [Shewanella sp.]